MRGQVLKDKKELMEELACLEELEEIQNLTAEQLARRGQLQSGLATLLEEKEEYWHKRSNETWLLKGDNNTEFFRKIANGRRRKNKIFSLRNGDQVIQGTADLVDHATSYYKTLLGPAVGFQCRLRPDVWGEHEKLSGEDVRKLSEPFSEDEIKKVVFGMRKNKAAGCDGFPTEFYQACWEFIKYDLMMCFHDFYNGKLNLSRINYGIITLLPKGAGADTIQRFRPICLLPVFFKMFPKTLDERVKLVVQKLIARNQSAFIKGRNIMDGVMSLHEIVHGAWVKKQQGVVLKLDFEKAYDKFNWDFLFQCLGDRGFRTVVKGGTLNVKVNDTIGKNFGSFKGVRQGDPLSPFLFNIAANCLFKMVENAQESGQVTGMVPHLIDRGVARLQYADDTIILMRDNMECVSNMKLLLYLFEQMSGLKNNFEKSAVMVVLHDDDKGNFHADMLNCQYGSWPIKYLGVPISCSRLHVEDWVPTEECMYKRMDGWESRNLSIGGRFTRAGACLTSMPVDTSPTYL